MTFVCGLQTLKLINFPKIFQIKGLKPKNKGHTNFYECCDLTKKVCLVYYISNTLMTYHKPQSTHPQDHYYRALDIHSWPRFHQRKARIWHTWGSSVFHKGHGDLGNIKLNQNMQSKDSTYYINIKNIDGIK